MSQREAKPTSVSLTSATTTPNVLCGVYTCSPIVQLDEKTNEAKHSHREAAVIQEAAALIQSSVEAKGAKEWQAILQRLNQPEETLRDQTATL